MVTVRFMTSKTRWTSALIAVVFALAAASCSSTAPAASTSLANGPSAVNETIPVFIIAGQSNAEGAAPLSGLEALADALPSGDKPLTTEERAATRSAFQAGIGAMCEDDHPTPASLADASINALVDSGLPIVDVDQGYTIPGSEIVGHRYHLTDGNEPLTIIEGEDSPDAAAWDRNDPAPLGAGYGFISDEATFYGPELGMGLELDRHLDQFGVVKVTMSGSTLFDHWSPDSEMRKELFIRTNDYLDTRPNHEVAAFVWFQGFSDQFEEFSIRDYDSNLNHLITDVREVYGEDMPVIVVEARRPEDLPTLSEIADAQQRVVEGLPNAALVPSSGLTTCFHYDSASQIVVGQRVAQAWLELRS